MVISIFPFVIIDNAEQNCNGPVGAVVESAADRLGGCRLPSANPSSVTVQEIDFRVPQALSTDADADSSKPRC